MLTARRFIALTLLLGFLPGCGSGTASVSGKVTYLGKPLVCGTVQFLSADGLYHSANIEPDGTYRCDLTSGLAKIGIVSPRPEVVAGIGDRRNPTDAAPKRLQPDASQWVKIPDIVSDPKQSGLSVTVSGTMTYDIVIPE